MKCNKICWELMKLTEKQAKIIKKFSIRIKELESIIESLK
jgi:hypothetical protein